MKLINMTLKNVWEMILSFGLGVLFSGLMLALGRARSTGPFVHSSQVYYYPYWHQQMSSSNAPTFTGTNPKVFKRAQQAGIIKQHLESLAIPGIYIICMYSYTWCVCTYIYIYTSTVWLLSSTHLLVTKSILI